MTREHGHPTECTRLWLQCIPLTFDQCFLYRYCVTRAPPGALSAPLPIFLSPQPSQQGALQRAPAAFRCVDSCSRR